MAGTKPRRNDPAADALLAEELLASATYRHEHQVTIDAVHDTLLTFSSYVDYEPTPSVVPLANVVHLATQVEGRLSHPPASILELVDALHPTPAVCGRPRAAALSVIAELEELDRGRYAGAVGWVDADGNGDWAVAIRGAEISGTTARVIAGNGMVGDSDPPTELIETRAKLQAMLSAIVRP
jgi:isochorismate synthase EntC